MNILLTQVIYIYNNNSFCRWRNSFNSIKKYKYNFKIKILISGYVSEQFINLVNDTIRNQDIRNQDIRNQDIFYNKNVGKSLVINNIIDNKIFDEYDIHIFMDSDIILENNTIIALYELFLKSKFDLLLPNHKQDIRHITKNISEITLIDDYKILWNKQYNQYSYAGGFFITTRNIMKKNKFDSVGQYGPDDTYFFKKLYENNIKIGLVDNIYIIHPFDIDIEYNNKKIEILKKFLTSGDD
jgi:hypothetical protein